MRTHRSSTQITETSKAFYSIVIRHRPDPRSSTLGFSYHVLERDVRIYVIAQSRLI